MYTAPGHAGGTAPALMWFGEKPVTPQRTRKRQGDFNEWIQGTQLCGPAEGGATGEAEHPEQVPQPAGSDDPAVKQRQAEREAAAAERAKAKLVREAAKAEQKLREAEAAAAAAAQLAREKEEAVAREAALEAERKAARDARYAARKKKKK